ncbi:hypothetical protein KBC80_03305 [Candidatus Woesebacteria bacterium]|nr:hypothetical protein [Candidatus Woesebacteria bacterium]
MTEQNDQPIPQEATEAKVESKIADKFASAREVTMRESDQISEIYRSLKNPSVKDVYSSWVKNMDVVANTYSWGKDKPTFKTHLIRSLNRVVGVGAAVQTGLADIVTDVATWPLRKFPILKQTIGHFIPVDNFKRHSVQSSLAARNEGLLARGVGKVVETPFAVVGGAFKSIVGGVPEARTAGVYVERKVSGVVDAILHPKQKAI